ncbi:MAG: Ig-like domain-containing protein, partial [Rhodococcus sp.]|nr:Ig-like domain-containing protein [Rhodococcus sp. (in: high G+C Gram-positive bacteria)]
EDADGNRSAPTTGTVTPTDTTPPTLVTSVPADGASGIAAVSVLRFEFSEPMLRAGFDVQACEVSSIGVAAPCGSAVSTPFDEPTWSEGDATAQLGVAGMFAAGVAYRVTVTGSDTAGNELATTAIEFAVAAVADDTPPQVIDVAATVDAGLNRLEAVFTFSEAMDQGSVQDAFESQPSLACSWTWIDPQTVRCRVTSGLQQFTDYLVVFGVGAADTVGNTLEVPWSTTVAVGDLAPQLVKVTPGYDALNVNVTSPISFTFTEALDPTSLAFSAVKNSNSTAVPGSVSFATDSKSFTFTPSQSYGYSEFVFWYVTTLKDATGTSIPAPLSGSFRTRLQAGF